MVVARRIVRQRQSEMTLFIFSEEESMKEALNILLPKIGIEDFKVIPHQGVRDLERSLARKLRAWNDPAARFLVLRDNDKGDCIARKARLAEVVASAGKTDQTKIRIVCQELEAWFIGDIAALRAAGIFTAINAPKAIIGDPDDIDQPIRHLKKMQATYQKTGGARAIAEHMEPECNRSESFQQTMRAAKQLSGTI